MEYRHDDLKLVKDMQKELEQKINAIDSILGEERVKVGKEAVKEFVKNEIRKETKEVEEKPMTKESKKKVEEVSTTELIKSLADQIAQQSKIIQEQQAKMMEQEQKINNILTTVNTVMENPQMLFELLGQPKASSPNIDIEGVDPEEALSKGGVKIEGEASLQQQTPQPQQQPQQAVGGLGQAAKGIDFDKISDVLKSIAIITSNLGAPQPRQQQNPVAPIIQSIDVATSIAGALGEGLGKLFDAFNRMQDRAYKSWAVKAKTGKAEEDIEKVIEDKLEKKLSAILEKVNKDSDS